MLYGGIDIGAQSVKAVVFDGEKIIGNKSAVTEKEADAAAKEVFEDLLTDLQYQAQDVGKVFATGCGAGEVSFAVRKSSEQICAARGARWLVPTARTVVDLGAEGCRVMKLGPQGTMEDFANNAKCASGTGSSIELGAVYLKVPVDQMGPLSMTADGVAEISSTCAVFAESVIISHIHNGESRERIAAGIHRAVATRVIELIGRVGLVGDAVIVGGAAMNSGLVKALEEMTGVSFRVPENPRTAIALGAAIQAFLKRDGGRNRKSFNR
jgi:predicted CoA-substrate-specific enzyme activase